MFFVLAPQTFPKLFQNKFHQKKPNTFPNLFQTFFLFRFSPKPLFPRPNAAVALRAGDEAPGFHVEEPHRLGEEPHVQRQAAETSQRLIGFLGSVLGGAWNRWVFPFFFFGVSFF